MGTGTDVAIESAEITLIKGDLQDIVKAKKLSGKVMRNIKQNLFFAFFYNVLGIPIAAGVLYFVTGWLLWRRARPLLVEGGIATPLIVRGARWKSGTSRS